jgi:hypothetical protein
LFSEWGHSIATYEEFRAGLKIATPLMSFDNDGRETGESLELMKENMGPRLILVMLYVYSLLI